MIPREILKTIRQIEIRTNRIVTETLAGSRFIPRIPTGFRPKAQGWSEPNRRGATLGQRPINTFNRNAVAAIPFSSIAPGSSQNPVGVDPNLDSFTQGSSYVATLGWRPESRWDSRQAANPVRADSSFIIQPSSFSPA